MADQSAEARRTHYAGFYDAELRSAADKPLVLVYGNCQAESVRVVIDASTTEVDTVRVPPVHELEAGDLPHLRALVRRAAVIASQPVRDGYRDLPLGTDELASIAPGATVIRWPVVRYTGLHPYAAIIRHPWRGDPPVVPYHDLRTILAHRRGLAAADRPAGHRLAAGYRAVAAASLAALRARESSEGLVPAADLVEAAGADAMHTVNHPTNAVLMPLAARIMAAAGLHVPAVDPGRVLLASISAPLDRDVLDALGLTTARASEHWVAGDRVISDAAVAEGQVRWYDTRPEITDAATTRYASTIEHLGL